MWVVVMAVVFTACGRVGFDARGDAAGTDASADVTPRPAPRVVVFGTDYMCVMAEAVIQAQAASFTVVPDDNALDSQILDSADLIVIVELTTSHTAGEGAALANWVSAGGSLLVVSSYNPGDDAYYNPLLSGLAIQVDGAVDLTTTITSFAPHPLTRNVTSLPYLGGFTLVHGAGAWTDFALSTGMPTGPVGAAATINSGRVVIWGDEWVSYDQGWTMYDLPAFWTNAVSWLTTAT